VAGVARAGNQLAADRYTYLACLSWAILAGVAFAAALHRAVARRAPITVAAVAILAVLSGLTIYQARIWRDSIALWARAVQLDPDADRAAMNLASAYVDAGRYREAADIYKKKIADDPMDRDARYSLAMLHLMASRYQESEGEFHELVRDIPDYPMGYYGLGILNMKLGRLPESRSYLEQALKIDPSLDMARSALKDLDGIKE
jgi:tetratricopeptide (TPR) repeat protein